MFDAVAVNFPQLEDLGKMEGRAREAIKWSSKGPGEQENGTLTVVGLSPQYGFASYGRLMHGCDRYDYKLESVRTLADKILCKLSGALKGTDARGYP